MDPSAFLPPHPYEHLDQLANSQGTFSNGGLETSFPGVDMCALCWYKCLLGWKGPMFLLRHYNVIYMRMTLCQIWQRGLQGNHDFCVLTSAAVPSAAVHLKMLTTPFKTQVFSYKRQMS